MADAYAALQIANRYRGENSSIGVLADAFLSLVVTNPFPPRPLTRRQAEIMLFLTDYIDANGYAPSFEEIADRFGYRSLATVHEHMQSLERKDWITRQYNEARSITVLHRVPITDPSEAAKYAVSDPNIYPDVTV